MGDALTSEQQFFSVLQSIDDYLAAQEELATALKDGLFNIAKSKYALGPGALGQQCYPGDMQATAVVQVVRHPVYPDSLYDEFQLVQQQHPVHLGTDSRQHHHQQQQTSGCEQPTEKQQQRGTEPASSSSNNSSHASDPVAWFSALPPAPLRGAQKDFQLALQRIIAAANVMQRLRQQVDEFQEVAGHATKTAEADAEAEAETVS